MANRAAIRQKAIDRVTAKLLASADWDDVVTAFNQASPGNQIAFVRAYSRSDARTLLRQMDTVMRSWAAGVAAVDVDAALADDSLTLDEYEALFG